MSGQRVYDFAEGAREMRELLGGKGANIAEMTRLLGPDRVPAGVHDHDRGLRRLHGGRRHLPRRPRRGDRGGAGAPGSAGRQAARRPRRPAAGLGPLRRPRVDAGDDGHRPQPRPQRRLGRRASRRAPATSASPGTPTAASCRCTATSSLGIEGRRFEDLIQAEKRERGVSLDVELDAAALRRLTEAFKSLARPASEFPADPPRSCTPPSRAVFGSWKGERAVTYRRLNHIPDSWGTAVNVQQMVFGNKGETPAPASPSAATR